LIRAPGTFYLILQTTPPTKSEEVSVQHNSQELWKEGMYQFQIEEHNDNLSQQKSRQIEPT